MKNTIFFYIAIVSAILFNACSEQTEVPQARPSKEKPVVVMKTYQQTFFDKVDTLGSALAFESTIITSRASGVLEEILFTDGQHVKQGGIVAKLDQDEEQAQLKTAQIQLLEHEREIKRLTSLLAKHAASERDLDERKTLAEITKSNIKEIKSRINDLTLKAPFSGKLGIRQVSLGALIQPGTIITTLDQTDKINIDFSIPASQLKGIQLGTVIQAKADALSDIVFTGKITSMDTRLNPNTRTIKLRATINNPNDKLIVGMLMQITILKHERQAFVVPEESVIQKVDKHFITLVNAENKVEVRPVVIGQRNYGNVEIVSGLNINEKVMVRGMDFVKPGALVSIAQTWDKIEDAQFPRQSN